ncbi:MAG: S46 family peptidase [Bacteroidales bacterium]|nr:S46 family peptidase [Bacteroidales bacterium]
MKTIFRRYILALAAVASCLPAMADEGMWMINAINAALEKKMQERGLQLSACEIYNADAEGAAISDAIVSLEFSCTGSIISDQGLLITNHHCAYSDVFGLSTEGHNYLEDGFWAMESGEEIPVTGKKALFLKKVIDVTEEAEAMIEKAKSENRPLGTRKLGYLLEKKYSSESGLEAWFSSMWKGSRYYIALYKVYSDVRLVAAPPVSMAAFGGDIDNWEWPQHKCDFAMYRIYTAPDGSPAEYSAENIPLRPEKKLKISLGGYQPGDFTMVIGFPGRTDRYSSSFNVDFKERVSLPISNMIRAGQMDIVNRWMNADPSLRLKYSDYYFGLSNVQELNEGEVLCYGRFCTSAYRKCQEGKMKEWIGSCPERQNRWCNLTGQMSETYARTEDIRRNAVVFRETIVRGTNIARFATRINSLKNSRDNSAIQERLSGILDGIRKGYGKYDMRVEKDLFGYAFEKYYTGIAPEWLGEYQRSLVSGIAAASGKEYIGQLHAMADSIWNSSFITSPERFETFAGQGHTLDEYMQDPLLRFLGDVKITDFNLAKEKVEGDHDIVSLEKEYTHALYCMREDFGMEQYPDANSTMRITYGTVGTIEPYDAVQCSWQSTASGILEKADSSSYEFSIGEKERQLLESNDWGSWGAIRRIRDSRNNNRIQRYMPVDFLTDNDITGGNSGSPVLNARGELIGLAFDGNKESLASDAMYVDGYNKCVCVDIRFILWTLDRYAGMDRIIAELGL